AVGCGMVMAATLSQQLGRVSPAYVARLTRLIASAGLPTRAPVLGADNAARYLALMRVDKKAEDGEIRFVVVDEQGHAVTQGVADALVAAVIDACVG
ncbi:MAG: 3-dehydroquinate synthase family protein, partial [Tepidimonas sp.]|uniref:3-dehydroquinate synthase family protein n=1 Tax=Tepidimonas sp. TaxID=2002775 RepID=UPI004054BB81